jgi:hypothetical protein
VVVTIVHVRTHSSVFGSFQYSHKPASANGRPSGIAIAYGCFFFPAAFHSKKLSTAMRQRRFANALRNMPEVSIVSARALMVRQAIFAALANDETPLQIVERTHAGLAVEAHRDDRLPGRGVVRGRRCRVPELGAEGLRELVAGRVPEEAAAHQRRAFLGGIWRPAASKRRRCAGGT